MVGGPAKLSEKGSLVCKHSNEGEPSDDPSKIRGEIPSSGDLVTLPPNIAFGYYLTTVHVGFLSMPMTLRRYLYECTTLKDD